MNHYMETLTCGAKIGAWMASSALFAIVVDATTNVPLLWVIASCAAIAGGVWKLAVLLTKIDDRLTALEERKKQKDNTDS